MQRNLSMSPCQPHEYEALVKAATRVFRGEAAPWDAMAKAYPLLFGNGNLHRLWIARAGERLVAHVGYAMRRLLAAENLEGHLATFGAVFVVDDYAGRGIATRLLNLAVAAAQEEGAAWGMISGSRSLYRRAGFAPLPAQIAYRIDNGALGAVRTMPLRAIAPEQWAEANALFERRACPRILRNPEQWQAILHSGTVFYGPGSVLAIGLPAEPPRAYFAVEDTPRARAGKPSVRVLEWAGDAQVVAEALTTLATPGVAVDWVATACEDDVRAVVGHLPQRPCNLGLSFACWRRGDGSQPAPSYGLDYL